MIVGLMSVYNEGQFIRGAIKNLREYADRVIVVDGAYADFPIINDSHKSTDQTLAVAREEGAEIIEAGNNPWKDQQTKRNQYLIGNVGDWYLMLDADERFFGQLPIPRQNDDAFRIAVHMAYMTPPTYYIRFFRHQPGIHYWGAHNLLFDGRLQLIDERTAPGAYKCWIDHFSWCRDKRRKQRKAEYYISQTIKERPFREMIGRP